MRRANPGCALCLLSLWHTQIGAGVGVRLISVSPGYSDALCALWGTRPGLGVGLEGVKGLEGPYEEWLRALGWFHLGETIWGL